MKTISVGSASKRDPRWAPLRAALAALVVVTSAACGGTSDPVGADAGSHSACGVPLPSTMTACGAVDGVPYFGIYDGCNWCTCDANGAATRCTTRACFDDDGGVGSASFTSSDCNTVYYGVSFFGVSMSYVCDEEGHLFIDTCAPGSIDGGIRAH